MLPGFRFLFAAIVLTMSILIFGLGAAALLRAAHDQFASMPSRRALQEPVFVQQLPLVQPNETPAATLAMLRVEPPVVENTPAATIAALAPEAPSEAAPVPPVETAALKVDNSVTTEPAKPEAAAGAEPPPSTEAAPDQIKTPASTDEVRIAAVDQATPSDTTAAASVVPEPAILPSAPESIGSATKIAALGNPAATVEGPASAKPKSAQSDKSAIRKRQQAKRAKERRRLAALRARLAREAAAAQLLQQTQPDPFVPQPTITTAATPVRRR